MSAEAVDYHGVRRDYNGGERLLLGDAIADPLTVMSTWLDMALRPECEGQDANVMALATVASDGLPDVRYVLLKEIDDTGIVFYTDSTSAKGQQLAATPTAAVAFHWRSLDRQVRIRGPVAMISPERSDRYWAARPIGSQLSAAASNQSSVINERETVLAARDALVERHGDTPLQRPERWNGYHIAVQKIEFWQGQSDRCHDRIVCRSGTAGWSGDYLAP